MDSYKDITPRVGVAYDVFGNGKTALKFNLGKYLEGRRDARRTTPTRTRPTGCRSPAAVRSRPATSTRTWTDANSNFVPDCDLLNPTPQICAHRRRFLRADLEPALRAERPDQQLRSRAAQRLGRPAVRLERRLRRAAADAAARVGGGRLLAAVVQRLHRQRQHRWPSHRTTRRTASSRRSIRGCPAAAATRCRACSTSIRRSSGQILNNVTDSRQFGTSISTSTASTSR